jgi:Putative adhesin
MRIVTSTAVLAGTVLALGACRVSVAATTYHEDHSYGLTAGALTIDSNSGDLEIVATDAPTISVHERLNFTRNRRPVTVHSVSGNTLSLKYSCPGGLVIGNNECSVDYQVQVPRATPVRVVDGSGNVTLHGLTGALNLQANSGDVTGGDLTGAVQVTVDSGSITLNGLTGTGVAAQANSGDITLAFTRAPGSVTAGVDSGSVRIALPGDQRYAVDARVDSGTRTVDVTQDPAAPHHVRATAGSGDVTVTKN